MNTKVLVWGRRSSDHAMVHVVGSVEKMPSQENEVENVAWDVALVVTSLDGTPFRWQVQVVSAVTVWRATELVTPGVHVALCMPTIQATDSSLSCAFDGADAKRVVPNSTATRTRVKRDT